MELIILAVFLVAIYVFLKAIRRCTVRTSPPEPAKQLTPAFHWENGGNFDFEVVGESYYHSQLRSLAGDHGDDAANVSCVALLAPEDENPHDNKAVSVHIGGKKIGYLSRDDARSFRRRLSSKKLTNQVTSCNAIIVGGGIRDGQRLSYGVWLDMKPFDN